MRQLSWFPCSITVNAAPGSLRADVRMSGELDLVALPQLRDALQAVLAAAPKGIFVDLAGVTFAGSVLPNFLAEVHARMPRGTSLVVCRPTPPIQAVLHSAGVSQLMTIRAGPLH